MKKIELFISLLERDDENDKIDIFVWFCIPVLFTNITPYGVYCLYTKTGMQNKKKQSIFFLKNLF